MRKVGVRHAVVLRGLEWVIPRELRVVVHASPAIGATVSALTVIMRRAVVIFAVGAVHARKSRSPTAKAAHGVRGEVVVVVAATPYEAGVTRAGVRGGVRGGAVQVTALLGRRFIPAIVIAVLVKLHVKLSIASMLIRFGVHYGA